MVPCNSLKERSAKAWGSLKRLSFSFPFSDSLMFSGRTVLVTGGSRGIGRAVVMRFLREGAIVHSLSRTDTAAVGPSHHPHVCDVTVESSIDAFFQKEFADTKTSLDVLINNAGVELSGVFVRQNLTHDYNRVLDTNLRAVLFTTKAALLAGGMIKRKAGTVVTIGSVVGTRGHGGQVLYSASKSALDGMTKSLTQEYGRYHVRFNNVCPGYIDTEMTQKMSDKAREAAIGRIPMARFGTVEEVAEVVCFVAASKYMSGQTLGVDGGLW